MNALQTTVNRRILVVDDNESIHRDFRQILSGSSAGDLELAATEAALFGDTQSIVRDRFELDSAYQGQQALEMTIQALAANRPYAMAFIDMRMPPGWDGIETIKNLWRCDPQLQIAICSAYSDCSWDEVTRNLDVRDRLLILKKPFDNIEIYQLASTLTAKWHMERRAAARLAHLEELVEQRTQHLRSANEALQIEMRERRKLESQLAVRQKLESIGQLAAGVAHEINTPIQYVGDSLHFLRSAFEDLVNLVHVYRDVIIDPQLRARMEELEKAADLEFLRQEIPRAVDRTLEGADRVASIVRAMKEFSHQGSTEQAPADINEALKTTLVVAHSEYKYVAQVETDFGELPPVICSIGEVKQVLLNLLVNAAHAIESAGRELSTGRISIRTRSDEAAVTISISDNGTGIPQNIVGKIFDPFFTTKEVGRGTGQGLAIAHTIVVMNHGGVLRFETVEGEGTTFFVQLPIAGLDRIAQSQACNLDARMREAKLN